MTTAIRRFWREETILVDMVKGHYNLRDVAVRVIEDPMISALQVEVGLDGLYQFGFVVSREAVAVAGLVDAVFYQISAHIDRIQWETIAEQRPRTGHRDVSVIDRQRAISPYSMLTDFGYYQQALTDYTTLLEVSWDWSHQDWEGFKERSKNNDAEKRAKITLFELLDESEQSQYEQYGTINVVGGSTGQLYQLTSARQVNIKLIPPVVIPGCKTTNRLCVVKRGSAPLIDQLISQVLMIRYEENEFLRLAIKW